MGYARAGFEVVGVDVEPQPRYPFAFVQADALDYLRWLLEPSPLVGPFDAIHASPPCQFASRAQRIRGYEHPDLIGPTRAALDATGLPYVIENVPGAPLRNPVRLEGQVFRLGTHRPRDFETNWPLTVPALISPPPSQAKMGRRAKPGEAIQVVGHFNGADAGRAAMGIDWMTREELREAVPPAYTEFVGIQLRAYLALLATLGVFA